jgi:hypothetical protein
LEQDLHFVSLPPWVVVQVAWVVAEPSKCSFQFGARLAVYCFRKEEEAVEAFAAVASAAGLVEAGCLKDFSV